MHVRAYVSGGRQMTHAIFGRELKSSAHWDGNVLVIETKTTNSDYTIRDRWVLADDHRSIRIDCDFSNAPGSTQRVVLEKQ